MTAASQVLNTAELLDHIIGYLDWRSALRLQSTARLWHDAVHSGTQIQYQLGFKAIDRRERWIIKSNSLGLFAKAKRVASNDETTSESEMIVTNARATAVFGNFAHLGINYVKTASFGNEYVFKWDAIPPALLQSDENASWRGMHISQPPATVVDISTVMYYRDALMYRRIPGHQPTTRLNDAAGITLGQVIELVKTWKATAPLDINWTNVKFAVTTVHMVEGRGFLYTLAPLD